MKNLERENQLLKALVVDLCTFITDLFKVMPDDIRTADTSVKMLEVAQRMIDAYGPSISTPNNSK